MINVVSDIFGNDEYITAKEAAAELGMTRLQFYRYRAEMGLAEYKPKSPMKGYRVQTYFKRSDIKRVNEEPIREVEKI